MSVATYFSKLKRLWDELSCITHPPNCTCPAAKETADLKIKDQLMQFLMGLNETYDNIKNQILVMEPFPNISKAYAMVLRVEKQKEVNAGQQYTSQNMAMQAFKKLNALRTFQKKKRSVGKRSQVCKHCGKTGHLKEVCFDIHGYHEWHKTFLEQKKENTTTTNKAIVAKDKNEKANNAVYERAVDHKTKDVIAIACLVGKFYVFRNESFEKYIEEIMCKCRDVGLIASSVQP
ncbi:UNVERIFIED_CONTAM: hypothetical protein Sindi_2462400 [Sesamum indicum]